ncbi:uncharacterized protein G2W53_033941 [Senna tora]|uniref:Uncharacterized protein n=1 Tax=Senna tora TaxID=362788 RepID=A0A834SZH9_9FABA|nr:uncharacterized protein G2W53_033941 [Senna tora]
MKQFPWLWTATVRDGRSFAVYHRVHRRREHRRLLLCASTEGASLFAAVCIDGESFVVVCALREFVFEKATQPSSWFHPEIEQEIERRVARAKEESNVAIKQLQENYRKEIDEFKKLIISSRNQHEQDDEASE